jgi:hypothetical protein
MQALRAPHAALRRPPCCAASTVVPLAAPRMAPRGPAAPPGALPCCAAAGGAVPDVEACAPPAQPWAAAHAAAQRARAATYADPKTGYTVFTEAGLLAQGGCCGGGCRHCPYGHHQVSAASRKRDVLPTAPMLLRAQRAASRGRAAAAATAPPPADVEAAPRRGVLWTGGGGDGASSASASSAPGGCAGSGDAAPLAVLLFDAVSGRVLYTAQQPHGGASPGAAWVLLGGACARATTATTADDARAHVLPLLACSAAARAAPPLHLHDAFDALLSRNADAAIVPLAAADGVGVAAQVVRALASLNVDAAGVTAAMHAACAAA